MNIIKNHTAVIGSITIFFIYLITLAPSVVQIDSGELAAVQITLGIAHPTGYPLFTMAGYLFSLIPLPFTKIFQMNLLAAVYCASAVGFFIKAAGLILENIEKINPPVLLKTKKYSKKDRKELNKSPKIKSANIKITEPAKLLAALFSGFILALSKTFWFQSTSVEVYSLHLMLICIVIFVLIKAFLQEEKETKFYSDYWFILAILLAFSFSNHMTTLLVLPAIAYLFFSKFGFNKKSFKKLFLMILLFLPLLIIIYSYLPIRAGQQPTLNWGNPIDVERIIRHVSGKQYQVWLFTSMDAAKKQLGYFFSSLTAEFNIGLIIIVLGIFASYKMSKKIFNFLSILFISTVLYSINYDIVDIDSYFLLAYISLAFFSAFGVVKIYSWLKFHSQKNYVIIIVAGIFIIIFAAFNFKKVDQSDTYIFENYSKSLINSTDKKSLILSYQWDFFISASYYFQNVENFRKDVVIVDKELLRRSWYYNQIERNHPEILTGLKNETGMFLEALKPFERNENFNPQLLESLYRQIMTKLITTNIENYSIYLAPELVDVEMQKGEFSLPQDMYLVPDLFLFKVVKTKKYIPADNPDFKISIPEQKNYYVNFIIDKVGSMLARRAVYELQFDNTERARLYINKIKNDLPDYKLSEALIKAIE